MMSESWPPPQTLLAETLPVVLGLYLSEAGESDYKFCWLEGLDGGFMILRSSWKLPCSLVNFLLRTVAKEPN